MAYDLTKEFARIEDELIASMIRNLEKHKVDEVKEGKEWVQWQAIQLRELHDYRIRNREKYFPEYKEMNSELRKFVEQARQDGQLAEEVKILEAIGKDAVPGMTGGFFKLNDEKIEALIQSLNKDFSRSEIAVLRRADDQYRQIIFNAQIAASSGAETYEKAVDMATHDFLAKGIDSIQYKGGARHTMPTYCEMALRTANKRASLIGAADKRNEWGINTVIVNRRDNPCPKCMPFVGRILIDDVYGAYGSGPTTAEAIPNYSGKLSDAISAGFLHPNCKDGYTTYFPGVTEIDDPPSRSDIEEMKEEYVDDQKRQIALNNYKKYQRLHDYSLDDDNKYEYLAYMRKWRDVYETYYKG